MTDPIEYKGLRFFHCETIVTLPDYWVRENLEKHDRAHVHFGEVCLPGASGAIRTNWKDSITSRPIYARWLPDLLNADAKVSYGRGMLRELVCGYFGDKVYVARRAYKASEFVTDLRNALARARRECPELGQCKVCVGWADWERADLTLYLETPQGDRCETILNFDETSDVQPTGVRSALELLQRLAVYPKEAFTTLLETIKCGTFLKDVSPEGIKDHRHAMTVQCAKDSGVLMDGEYPYISVDVFSGERLTFENVIANGEASVRVRSD